MRSKCSFILKASTALVLCFLMLFSTMATSLAAVVDNADTGANVDVADTGASATRIYVEFPDNDWNAYSTSGHWLSVTASGNKSYTINQGNTGGAGNYVPKNDTAWIEGTATDQWGVYYFDLNATQATNAESNGITFWSNNESGYDNVWSTCISHLSNSTFSASKTWYTIGSSSTTHDVRQAKCFTTSVKNLSLGTATANILNGTDVMFYIQTYANSNNIYLTKNSTLSQKSATVFNGSKGIGYLTVAKSDLSSYFYISNSSGWGGESNTDIKTATGGGFYKAAGDTWKGTAPTVTTTLSSTSFTVGTSSITASSTASAAVAPGVNLPLFYQYYIDGTLVTETNANDAPRVATSAVSKTLDVSSYAVGTHTVKTVLSDGYVRYVAASTDFTVTPATHSVTRSAPSNGSLELSSTSSTSGFGTSNLTVAEGANYWVKATPNTGYKISALTVGGSTIAAATGSTSAYTYTGTMGTSDVATSVTFAKQTYTVSYNKGNYGTGTNTTDTKTYGTALTLKGAIFTRTGYTQTGWNTNSSGTGGTHYALSGSYTANAAVTLYPEWTQNTYAITFTQNGGSGTLKVDDAAFTSGSTVTHGNHTFSVTAPSGYNVASISGIGTWSGAGTATATLGSTSITEPKTITVTYTPAGSCGFDLSKSSTTLNIGGTDTFTATPNGFHDGRTYTVTSGTPSVATVSGSNTGSGTATYTVTAVAPGDATITVSCAEGGSATFTVHVNTPTITVADNSTIKVGATYTPSATLTNPSATGSGWTVVYTRSSGTTASIAGSTITAENYGSATTFRASFQYNGEEKAYDTFTVTPATPTATFSTYSNIGVGATATASLSSVANVESLTRSFAVTAGADYATVNSSNGTVTGVKPGTATVTVYYKKGSTTILSKTANVTVTEPTVTITSANTANVNGTVSLSATSSGATTTPSYTWSVAAGTGTASVTGSTLTALTPGTVTVTVNAKYNASYTKSVNQTLTIATPTVTMSNQTVAKGDSVTFTATTSNPSSLTIAYAVNPAVTGVSINASTGEVTVASSCAASSATIVATAKNSAGTAVATGSATLTIEAPSMSIADTADGSTKYITIGTPYSKALSNNFGGSYNATSSNTSVATVAVAGSTLTVTPVAKGTSTITVTATKGIAGTGFLAAMGRKILAATGAESITVTETFTVNVAEASTDVVVLLQDFTYNSGDGWGTAYVHAWEKDGDPAIASRAAMTKIGTNGSGRSVYAYKFTASDWAKVKYLTFMRESTTDWNEQWDRTVYVFNGTHGSATSFQLRSDSDGSHRKVDTSATTIPIPQVVIDDASTPLGTNYTMPVTRVNEATVGKYKWTSATTSVATVTADTGTTASNTVVPVDAGTSEITVQAFAAAPTGWTLTYSDTTLPFLGTSDTATVTVTADNKTVTFGMKLSLDGVDYDSASAVGAGTITANGETVSPQSVVHGSDVALVATPNPGYKFVDWVDGNGTVLSENASYTISHITKNETVFARFNKIYHLTIALDAGSMGHGTVNSPGEDVLWNGTPTTITVKPYAGYEIDYDNCTNLSKYYTVDTSATTGDVNIVGKTVAEGDKADTNITIAFKQITYSVRIKPYYTTDGNEYTAITDRLFPSAASRPGTVAVTDGNGNDGTRVGDDGSVVATYNHGDRITLSATALASTKVGDLVTDGGYMLEGIYRLSDDDVSDGTAVSIDSTQTVDDDNTDETHTLVSNSITLNNPDASYIYPSDSNKANFEYVALFKEVDYITLYNSYVQEENGDFTFVASPPRTVKVGNKTYNYASGDDSQRGEEHLRNSGGPYYEGNRIQVLAGDQITLTYSTLASSDAITGLFFNNDLRYTTEAEEDNLYKRREKYTGDDPENWGDVGDDEWDYTFDRDTTLYIDPNYYTDDYRYEFIIGNIEDGNYEAQDGVNQNNHTVTWTATRDYLNIDMELASKYQLHINKDDWSGLNITGMNDEGYYSHSESFGDAFKIGLDNESDTSGTYSFTSRTATFTDKDGNTIDAPAGITVTAKQSNGSDATMTTNISYFLVEGEMPNQDVYISVPVVKNYNMKLANIVVTDTVSHKTMLTETNSNSTSATGNIGTITAEVKNKAGETVTADISSDGTYYTYNNGVGQTNNTASKVEVYTTSSSNKYLKGGVNKNGSNVAAGNTVTYTFTFADGKNAEYSFVGWFEGTVDATDNYKFYPDYTKKLSGKTSFTYTPNKNTVVFAVGTRDLFLGGNFTSDGAYTTTSASQTWAANRIQMEYDPTYVNPDDNTKIGRYYYTFDTVNDNTEYKFRVYDAKSGTEFTNLDVWNTWLTHDNGASTGYNQDNVDIAEYRDKYDAGGGHGWTTHGGFKYTTATGQTITHARAQGGNELSPITITQNNKANGYAAPVTVYFYAYDGGMSVDSTYQWSMAYVSEGRGIDVLNPDGTTNKYNIPTASVANKTVNNETVTVTKQTNKYGNGNNNGKYETIYECQVKEKDGTIVVTANPNDPNVDLQAFLVYNIETKKSEAVTEFADNGDGTYTGNITIPQNSKVYVVPIYKFTDAYIEASDDLDSHNVYVRTSDIDKNKWGGLVAMYSWGTDARYNSGGWPGQLMIPADDGQSFYAPLTFTKNGLAGVSFNNYEQIYDGGHTNFIGTYEEKGVSSVAYSGNSGKLYQTYDYREPISIIDNINAGIYDSEDMDLTFALKPGNKTAAPTTSGGSSAFSSATSFEYLTDSSGKYRVDLNGDTISTNPTATYTVICSYTNAYKSEGGSKSYDFVDGDRDGRDTHNEFSIEWTVYNANGTVTVLTGSYLSAAFTDVYKGEMLTYIADKMIAADLPVSSKAVRIAYENPGEWDEAIRYSGQWYSDSVNTLVEANVRVGIFSDGAWTVSDSNAPGYGTATVSDATLDTRNGEELVAEFDSGNSLARVTKTHASDGAVTFSVDPTDENFLGWYRSDGEGGYEPVGSNYQNKSITLSFSDNVTYYAFYSASASYRFKYKDRNGNDKYFTAKGTDLTDAELAANGILDAEARAADITEKLRGIYDINVYNRTLSYDLGDPDTTTPYTITFTAGDTENTYKLTVFSYNESGSLVEKGAVSGKWSTEIDVTAHKDLGNGTMLINNKPSGQPDSVFIGWAEYDGENAPTYESEILSTQAKFGYSITQDTTIAPVFGTSDQRASVLTDEWTAGIDKNEITQELTDANTGKVYNDTLISFRNAAATGTALDISGAKECGIFILAQTSGVTAAQNSNFTAITDDTMKTYLSTLKTAGRTSAKLNVTTYGEAYGFYVKANSLSALNRVNIAQALDYASFSGGQYKVMSYYYDGTDYIYSDVVIASYTRGVKYPAP